MIHDFGLKMSEEILEGLLKKIFRATGKAALATGFVVGLVTVGSDYSSLETVTEYVVHATPWAGLLYGSASLMYSEKK